MAEQHTPGPWEVSTVDPFVEDEGGILAISAPDHWRDFAHVFLHRDGPEEGEANARLMAVAPELLEALRDILGPLATIPMADTGHYTEQRPAQPNLRVSDAAIHRARAAIAKVEGRAG